MQNNKLTAFQSIKLGLKRGWETPTLPDHLLTLEKQPHIRLLRVIGGICILLNITKQINNIWMLYLSLLICIIYLIYSIYITQNRIRYIYKLLKSDKLYIRNSPIK